MTHILRTLALPTALVATIALASCGNGASTPSASTPSATAPTSGAPTSGAPTSGGAKSDVGPPATGASGPADVSFANTMMFWHLKAEQLVGLAPDRAKDAKVKALAAKVEDAQAPEIKSMSGWLVGGGIPAPSVNKGEVHGHTMPGMGGEMATMTTTKELAALGKATGAGFDRMWLQLMIKHHRGAVATARTELSTGVNVDAKAIAKSVVDRQSAQIAEMTSILSGIPQP